MFGPELTGLSAASEDEADLAGVTEGAAAAAAGTADEITGSDRSASETKYSNQKSWKSEH